MVATMRGAGAAAATFRAGAGGAVDAVVGGGAGAMLLAAPLSDATAAPKRSSNDDLGLSELSGTDPSKKNRSSKEETVPVVAGTSGESSVAGPANRESKVLSRLASRTRGAWGRFACGASGP